MASTPRVAVRAAIRQLRHARTYRTSSTLLAAHNFTMPALSPTMTEGNIASWKVKEGDEFSAGDVLLEVETDKAQMDVEAPDDGIMAKIMTEGGSKAVKVGTRIAVIADPGDDVSTLEMPAEEASTPSPAAESETQSKSPPKESSSAPSTSEQKQSKPQPSGQGQKQKYPLYPSVQVLIHQHDLNAEDIRPTGPNGRLLKGDVLAHLNEIPAESPQELAARVMKLSHLDLSNIKAAAPKTDAKSPPAPVKQDIPTEQPVSLAVPVSLSAALQVQSRMQKSLGITLPLSVFIARAVSLANEDLPVAQRKTPSADELFDAVLGLDKIAKRRTSDGHFSPQIVALPDPSLAMSAAPIRRPGKSDILDELVRAGPSKLSAIQPPRSRTPGAIGAIGEENIFSLDVAKAHEKRAKVFLERVKTFLEAEPGRLVL